ncbi:hypothetical protein Cs7R123_14930 [Catellatospora sp. TT07R-123]|uniref:hypothetical protein n=1 Tax=Catellatospora sp. TT07R-123 TaxID=2733863 RepID=UPI001B27639F|nr:hypothetical protein [Catellatospora sp. TT07R-123]GHJ44151.1 hypothetical protein Cs7R123_14930 [Catellatospora sp. TT07R-123]
MRVELALPQEPELLDVELVDADRGEPLPAATGSRCRLGTPVVHRAKADDGRLLVAVALPCGFTGGPEPVTRAALTAALRSRDGSAVHPVAYGLSPARLAHATGSRPAALAFEVSWTPAVKVEFGTPAEPVHAEYYLRAYGEGASEVTWKFRETTTARVDGVEWLAMVVVADPSAGGEAELAVTASVRRAGGDVAAYRAKLPDHLARLRLTD